MRKKSITRCLELKSKRIFQQFRLCHYVSVTLFCSVQFAFLHSHTVMAQLSGETGRIQGTAPITTGTIQLLYPDNRTYVVNNITLPLEQIPEAFSVSTNVSELVVSDEDGDTGLSVVINNVAAELAWKYNGEALNDSYLGVPLEYNFPGEEIELVVNVPVISSSETGQPTQSEPQYINSTYSFQIPIRPVIRVNQHLFSLSDGFPSTGFEGVSFEFLMNGSSTEVNDRYEWSVNQSWVTVQNGNVIFNGTPEAEGYRTVVVKAVRNEPEEEFIYTFTIDRWFTSSGMMNYSLRWENALEFCNNKGYDIASINELTSGRSIRMIGSLYSEWGGLEYYFPEWQPTWNGVHWTSTAVPEELDMYMLANMNTGSITRQSDTALGLEYKAIAMCSN
ncbi:TPA: hypothetical protein OTT35_000041 [Citrobacter koseri]|nr:hypothetical protein [Citrobacter koseri]